MTSATHVLRLSAWCCVVLLAVLSLLPAEEMVRTGVDGHLEHGIAYAGTAFLFGVSYPDWGWKKPATGLVIYAAVLEVLQTFPPAAILLPKTGSQGPQVFCWGSAQPSARATFGGSRKPDS